MGSTDQNVSALLLRFSTDKASLAEAQNALVSLQQSQEELTAAQAAGNSQAAITAMRQQADAEYQFAEAIQSATSALDSQRAVAEKTAQELADIEKIRADLNNQDVPDVVSNNGGGGSGLGAAARTGAQLAGSLGLQGAAGPLRIVGDVARLQDELPKLGVSFTELVTTVAPVAPIVLAAAVAIKVFNDNIAEGKKQLAVALQVQTDYYNAVRDLTTQQAKDQIKALQDQRAALQAQLDENTRAIANAGTQKNIFGFTDTVAAALATEDLRKKQADLADQINKTDGDITRLTGGLQDNAFAANDAAEAEKKLAETRAQAALATADAAGKNFQSDQQLLRGSAGQVRDALQSLSDQMGANAESISSLIASGDQSATVQEKIKSLTDDNTQAMDRYQHILTDILPTVEANDQAERQLAQTRQTALYLSDQMTKAQEDAAKADADYVKAVQATADGTIKATDDLNKATSAALSALNASIASAQQQANDALSQANRQASDAKADALQNAEDARTDAQIKAQQARLQAEADYQRKVRDIERQFQVSSENAIQDRDAVALDAARTTRKNELQQASEDYQAKLKAIDSDLKEQNRLIDRRYKEQIAQIDRRLQEQKADIDRRLQEQVQAAEQKYQQAVDAAKAAYDKQLADLQTKLTQEQAIRDAADANALAAINNFVTAAQNKWNSLPGNSGSTTTTTTTGSTGTQNEWGGGGYAGGGYPSMFQPFRMNERGIEAVKVGNRTYAVLTKPGRVYSASQTAAMMGGDGTTVVMHIHAPNWRGIQKQMNRNLKDFIRGHAETYGRN